MRVIPAEQYARIVEVLPILCVDVVAQNERGEYLLVKRTNEPLKGEWWVIGGRVIKGENLEQAAIRKVREEASLQVSIVQPIGYFESVYQEDPFGLAVLYHAVSVVFLTAVDSCQPIQLDHQSSDFSYSSDLPKAFKVKPFICSPIMETTP